MKATIKVKQNIDIRTCKIKAEVRYWEDATINGVEDTDGELTPCREGNLWCPVIDMDSGRIKNWPEGTTAEIHFKVCDAGSYYLLDQNDKVVLSREQDYVPNDLIPGEYGDYIIMTIEADGKITEWNPTLDDFEVEEDE